MKKFAKDLINAFRPASLRKADSAARRQKEIQEASDEYWLKKSQKEHKKKRQLIEEYIDPMFAPLLSLPEKNGKKFYLREELNPGYKFNAVCYGTNDVNDKCFIFGGFRKTIFGNIRFDRSIKYVHDELEMSQSEMAQKLALWINQTAPDRAEEIQKTLRQPSQKPRPPQ